MTDGNIRTTWYVNPDDSLASTFVLTAVGLNSAKVATAMFTDATPDANWLANLNENTFTDHNTTTAYNPSRGEPAPKRRPGKATRPTFTRTGTRPFEHAAQTDIVTYKTAADGNFFYFRFALRGAVDGNESTVYHVEIDADFDDAGGDAARTISSTTALQTLTMDGRLTTPWRNANLIDDSAGVDNNNSSGGTNLRPRIRAIRMAMPSRSRFKRSKSSVASSMGSSRSRSVEASWVEA